MTINEICLSQIEDRVNEDTDENDIDQLKGDIKWLIARVRALELELHNAERELKATYDGVIICR